MHGFHCRQHFTQQVANFRVTVRKRLYRRILSVFDLCEVLIDNVRDQFFATVRHPVRILIAPAHT